jgi:hypothetical protein
VSSDRTQGSGSVRFYARHIAYGMALALFMAKFSRIAGRNRMGCDFCRMVKQGAENGMNFNFFLYYHRWWKMKSPF